MFIRSTSVLGRQGLPSLSCVHTTVPSYMKTAARLYAAQHQWKPGDNYQMWRPGGIKEIKDEGPAKEEIPPQAETRVVASKPSYSTLRLSYPKGFEEGAVEKVAMDMAKGEKYVLEPGTADNWAFWLNSVCPINQSRSTTVRQDIVGYRAVMKPDLPLSYLLLVERYFMHNEVWHAQNAMRHDVNRELARVSALFQDVYNRILAAEKEAAAISKNVANLVDSPSFRQAIREAIMGNDNERGLIDDPEFQRRIKEIIK